MVIEKLYGLQSTSISLNDRFTMLASAAPDRFAYQKQRPGRPTIGDFLNQTLNTRNRNLIQQIARSLQRQAEKQALRQRLGMGPGTFQMRRYGSQNSLPGLRRSNSFGNFNQNRGQKKWRQSNGNLSRAASFSNLSFGNWPPKGFRKRGNAQRGLRGRFRGGRGAGGVTRIQQGPRVPLAQRLARAAGRISKNPSKAVPTKEELDDQLDQYMASTKYALDKELDTYMKNAMDLE